MLRLLDSQTRRFNATERVKAPVIENHACGSTVTGEAYIQPAFNLTLFNTTSVINPSSSWLAYDFISTIHSWYPRLAYYPARDERMVFSIKIRYEMLLDFATANYPFAQWGAPFTPGSVVFNPFDDYRVNALRISIAENTWCLPPGCDSTKGSYTASGFLLTTHGVYVHHQDSHRTDHHDSIVNLKRVGGKSQFDVLDLRIEYSARFNEHYFYVNNRLVEYVASKEHGLQINRPGWSVVEQSFETRQRTTRIESVRFFGFDILARQFNTYLLNGKALHDTGEYSHMFGDLGVPPNSVPFFIPDTSDFEFPAFSLCEPDRNDCDAQQSLPANFYDFGQKSQYTVYEYKVESGFDCCRVDTSTIQLLDV